jgi:integrase
MRPACGLLALSNAIASSCRGRARRLGDFSNPRATTPIRSAAYVLVLAPGLRKGEVLGLAWEAVNFEQGALVPDHQLHRVRRSLLWRETKTEASDAWLPMPDIVIAALTIRRTAGARAGVCRRDLPANEGHAVSDLHGSLRHPIDPGTLNRKFVRRCKAAGVRAITVHDARHTCATLFVDLDVHPRLIMRILRHADQAVTMEIYANASSTATQEALRRLGETLH